MMGLNAKQEAFAKEVVRNGGDKVAAFKLSWAWENYSQGALDVQANKQYNHPKINLRIKELQIEADKIAKEKFTISIEQRLKWLNEVAEAGLETYEDGNGVKRRENLTATSGAVKVLNEMLGIGGDENDTGESISINFSISEPVGKVKVTRGE